MSHEEFIAVKKALKRLRVCFENKAKFSNNDEDNEIIKPIMEYCIQVIDLHLELASLEFETEADKMAEYYGIPANQKSG